MLSIAKRQPLERLARGSRAPVLPFQLPKKIAKNRLHNRLFTVIITGVKRKINNWLLGVSMELLNRTQ